MTKPNINQAITKYEKFINDVLKEDLRLLHVRLQNVNAEISDLIQERHVLKVIKNKKLHPNGFKSQVNIGNLFFIEATVPDTSKLLMNIGLNHYLEFSLDEAIKYLDTRIKAYESKGEEIKNKSAETKAHIKLMLIGIGELQNTNTSKS